MQRPAHAPLGSNMNDASYPFRGDHRVSRTLNHGHGGTVSNPATSVTMAVTGTDLRIERVNVPSRCKLDCEIGAGNTRMHFQPAKGNILTIPNDGREYNLVSAVTSGNQAKHYSKLVLKARDDSTGIALRGLGMDAFTATVDGVPAATTADGITSIPRGAKECLLQPVLKSDQRVQMRCNDPNMRGFVRCEGVEYELNGTAPVDVPSGRGPLTLSLAQPDRPVTPPITGGGAQPAPETNVRFGLEHNESFIAIQVVSGNPHSYDVSIEGGGRSATGHGSCSLHLDPKLAHQIVATVSSGDQVLMRQSYTLPQMESVPVNLRIQEAADGLLQVFGAPNSTISVNGSAPFNGSQGCTLPREAATAVVHQANVSGPSSSAEIGFAGTPDKLSWLSDLAKALENPNEAEVVQSLSALRPQSREGVAIVGAIADLYGRPKPAFTLTQTTAETVSVSCPGFGVSASHGSQPPCVLPHGGGEVRVEPNETITVQALNPKNGQPAATCKFRGQGAAQPPPLTVSPNEKLLQDVLDALKRHPGDSKAAAGEIRGIQPDTPLGGQFLPLLLLALDAPTPAGDLLVPTLLQVFRACRGDRAAILSQLGSVQPTTDTGAQFMPLLIEALQQAGPAVAAPGSIQVNVDSFPPTVQLSAAVDGNPPVPIFPTTGLPIPSSSQRVVLSANGDFGAGGNVPRSASIVPEIAGILRRSPDAARRAEELAQLVPPNPDERELIEALLNMLRDNRMRRTPKIAFTAGDGCLQQIRCDGFELFVSVDGMPKMPLTQGAAVPRGSTFAEHTTHSVTLSACDPHGNEIATTTVTVEGERGSGSASGSMNFIDVEMSTSRKDAVVKLSCPQQFRMSYTLDGIGNDASGNKLIAKMDPQRGHDLVVTVVDGTGGTVFQQQLKVPRMAMEGIAVGLQENKMILQQLPGIITTASINGSPERILEDGTVALSPDCANRVVLRQFVGDANSTKMGELSLNLQQYVDPEDIKSLIRIYQMFDRNFGSLTQHLMQLHASAKGILMKQLISVLAGRAHDSFNVEKMQEYFDSVIKTIKETSFAAPPSKTLFFRLKGNN